MLLFFDTETTGLPDWKKPSGSPTQPHICQLSAILSDLEGKTHGLMNCLIRPEGWVIPDDVVATHGITTARAKAAGVPISVAMTMFFALWKQARSVVGHSVNFDKRMIRIEQKRAGQPNDDLDVWKAAPYECTQIMATKICKLPATEKMRRAGRGKQFKAPTLAEAYRHFTGKDLVGAHDSLVDTRACRTVYFAIKRQERAA